MGMISVLDQRADEIDGKDGYGTHDETQKVTFLDCIKHLSKTFWLVCSLAAIWYAVTVPYV